MTAPFRDCTFANADCTEITAVKVDDGRRVIFASDSIHGRLITANNLPVAPFSPIAIAAETPARFRSGVTAPASAIGWWC